MNSAQADRLLDLFLMCKLASEAWKDIAPINRVNGSDFGELSEVKGLADEVMGMGVPEERIVAVLRDNLPMVIFRKHFSAVTSAH